jgi:flagellar protein FlgJ
MALPSVSSSFYADPAGLGALRREAAQHTPEALREVAKQFESLFTNMILKSMRDASGGDPLMGSEQQEFYQDMFDQQLAVQLSKGKGLGLADMLMRQLMQPGGAVEAAPEAKPAPSAAVMSWPPTTREEFVQGILPQAQAAGRRLGVDPLSIIAHAALETGWGRSVPTDAAGRPSFNLFGIKSGSGWKGESAVANTREFERGEMRSVQAAFRSYESPAQSVEDYANFLGTRSRYAQVRNTGSDVAAFATALQRAGYATDPDYAKKLQAVASELKSHFSVPITATKV